MSAIRGRLGQFKVLNQQQQLLTHLIPTVHLKKSTLFSMLEHYDRLIIKPIRGTRFITIIKQDGAYILTINKIKHIVQNEKALYDILPKILDNQGYVIQPLKQSNHFLMKRYHRLVTLQQKNGCWVVKKSTIMKSSKAEGIIYYFHAAKIQKIACLAAETIHLAYANCETIVFDMSFNVLGEIDIHDSYLHFSVSKWNQYQLMKQMMPTTDLLTDETFQQFLKTYDTVILKPCNGQHGIGIIKITRGVGDIFEIHIGRTKWIKESVTEVILHLQELPSFDACYLIQQGISLAKIEHCVFDVRVLVQKITGSWYVTGKVVKIAGNDFFVTNAAKAIVPLDFAINQSTLFTDDPGNLDERIDQLCLNAAQLLDQHQSRTEIGFDVAITNSGELLIIEGNYISDIAMFHALDDQTMYKSILRNRGLVKQLSE